MILPAKKRRNLHEKPINSLVFNWFLPYFLIMLMPIFPDYAANISIFTHTGNIIGKVSSQTGVANHT